MYVLRLTVCIYWPSSDVKRDKTAVGLPYSFVVHSLCHSLKQGALSLSLFQNTTGVGEDKKKKE